MSYPSIKVLDSVAKALTFSLSEVVKVSNSL